MNGSEIRRLRNTLDKGDWSPRNREALDIKGDPEQYSVPSINDMARVDVTGVSPAPHDDLALPGLQRLHNNRRVVPLGAFSTEREQERVAVGQELRAMCPFAHLCVQRDHLLWRATGCRHLVDTSLSGTEENPVAGP